MKTQRLILSEYGDPLDLKIAARQTGIPYTRLLADVRAVAIRVQRVLSVSSAITISEGTVRAVDFAGVMRISPLLQMEVVPKFLSPSDPTWREDFMAIANVAQYGALLPHEELPHALQQAISLADMVGQVMIKLYDKNWRRPLRIYRKRGWHGFEADGELDEESVRMPDEDGYLQIGLLLDRNNSFNRTILEGMSVISTDAREGGIKKKLIRRSAELSPQTEKPYRYLKRLPSRCKRWDDLYRLAWSVVREGGARFGPLYEGAMPGFILRTADAWEALLRYGCSAGFNEYRVGKKGYYLGDRNSIGRDMRVVSRFGVRVYPDVAVESRVDGTLYMLLDAKYKASSSKSGVEGLSISSSDIYEAEAFLRASGCAHLILAYPHEGREGLEPGDMEIFERVDIGHHRVTGVRVAVRGLGNPRGFMNFSRNLRRNLEILR